MAARMERFGLAPRCGCVEVKLRPYGQITHLRFQGREVYPTEGSCRFPLIVLQQTTQSFFATHNFVVPARFSIRQWEGCKPRLFKPIEFLDLTGTNLNFPGYSDVVSTTI